jgi:hypothetical protein
VSECDIRYKRVSLLLVLRQLLEAFAFLFWVGIHSLLKKLATCSMKWQS